MTFPSEVPGDPRNLDEVIAQIKGFTHKPKGRVTLFLGAAISTFTPTQLPMWNNFVELLWTSALAVATNEMASTVPEGLQAYLQHAKSMVPNYLVTDVISRRLGQEYLQVLDAFKAETLDDGSVATNEIHRWTARCLSSGEVAAVMTTNFDDYLEEALRALRSNHYKITGDPHLDGTEISARLPLVTTTQKLVLIVNGAKSFAFVRTLMPQLGNGRMTFLFKLHGSCYDPSSCIDTRLQRAQGLPSFATDVLDTLLSRTTWVVAGFSGSDMNDNLDYLRFLSNKRKASIVWIAYPGGAFESSVPRLTAKLDQAEDSPLGLRVLHGAFLGDKTSETGRSPRFEQKIVRWTEGLGKSWCKLLIVDIVSLFEEKSGRKAEPELLQALNQGISPRQDWNTILEQMDLRKQLHQDGPARSCSRVWTLVDSLVTSKDKLAVDFERQICKELDHHLVDLRTISKDLETAAFLNEPPQIHAQTWVLSALSGLVMLLAGHADQARTAFETSSGVAWVVGDYESYNLLEDILRVMLRHGSRSSEGQGSIVREPAIHAKRLLAFSPSMDNVNSKMNRFGVPPQNYVRAILHRSLLFADGMAVPANTISNSTVLVDEVLFQGESDQLNATYIRHVLPILPSSLKDSPRKLQLYRDTRRTGYIFESIHEGHIAQLDDYFSRPESEHQIIYYDEASVSMDYGKYLRMLLDPHHRDVTVNHLTQLWDRLDASGTHQDMARSSAAEQAALDLVASLSRLAHFLPEAIFRSPLYKFADLFDEASDRESIESFLNTLEVTQKETRDEILSARDRIIEKPWLYGPFCHELFDSPYTANLVFDYASRTEGETLIFLEQEESPSWEFMSTVCQLTDASGSTRVATSAASQGSHKYSSLLLSQATEETLLKARGDLASLRKKILTNSKLSENDIAEMKSVMTWFESRSLVLPEVQVTEIVDPEPAILEAAKRLLRRCVFIVRKGPPLPPMYVEAQVTFPGLLALRHQKAG
ncbi:hypothetical protein LTR67_010552 [Exophiala xenobiotica]